MRAIAHVMWWLAAALAVGAPSTAAAAEPRAIARAGSGHGAAACAACHGADGAGRAALAAPRLAGLNADYLRKQLRDFASGSRESPLMAPIARALDGPQQQAMAAYYSALPLPPATARPRTQANRIGAWLATRGRWSQQVPACEQCHGPGGVGVGNHFPPLAGQPASYLQAQLQAWKRGTRHNDPLQLMQHLSRALSDQDIHAVATWFAAQPPTSRGTP